MTTPSPFAKPVANAFSSLVAAYVAGSGSMVLVSGASFGTLNPGEYLRITAYSPNEPVGTPSLSHFKVTAITGNNLTIAGAIDGSSDVNLSVGTIIACTIAPGTFTEIYNAIIALQAGVPATVPAITSSLTGGGVVGTAFNYQIAATNAPLTFGATNLPAGLTVNTSTGVISGVPTAAATTSIVVSATNAAGTGASTLVLTVSSVPAVQPVITSATTGSGQVGTAYNYQIAATNTPTSYGATNLPAGLSVNTTTGVISGTPTTQATTAIGLTATNTGGTGTATLTLTVNAAALDTRPRFGLGAANAYSASPQALITAMTAMTGSSNGGRSGTFNMVTTAGNYGWAAVEQTISASGVHFNDSVGFGGWSGAGLTGNNSGASPDPSTSTTTFTDSLGRNWRLFRMDYINASPSGDAFTLS